MGPKELIAAKVVVLTLNVLALLLLARVLWGWL
jgi:hypothetical protein